MAMMFPSLMSNSTSLSEDANVSSITRVQDFCSLNPMLPTISSNHLPQKIKKKRNLPGNPDPNAEVIALSPKTLLATNRFVCEICNKGFQRDQNLQLHRRGHNLPWKLKQRNNKENKKRAYVCPEPTCLHHHPSRALGDLTGIKKHYCRKHGEKKWKCEKCSKIYAVQSDWKAHTKTCGTREYRCDCGTLFSRKDSFITHRAFCDALAEESARLSAKNSIMLAPPPPPTNLAAHPTFPASSQFSFSSQQHQRHFPNPPTHHHISFNPWDPNSQNPNPSPNPNDQIIHNIKPDNNNIPAPISSSLFFHEPPPSPRPNYPNIQTLINESSLSATALLQKATTLGVHNVGRVNSTMMTAAQLDRIRSHVSTGSIIPELPGNLSTWQKSDVRLTRDFLGLTGSDGNGNVDDGNVHVNMRGRMVSLVELPTYERDFSQILKNHNFGFTEPAAASETWGNC
ncbi:hypothetical protein M9H77_01446 [Catharanthus roseus]|uniref:Uncharacterized protein n=1 Tax=Catharanthus roseus TaxID=4058 RepID=A0ACC0C5Y1_CATRO|nr:hypothetical protein M9H77_01446 [Catharanthus roseus]